MPPLVGMRFGVAIKFLPEPYSAIPDRLCRFAQETRAASSLNHPNIVTIHEVGQTDGLPFKVRLDVSARRRYTCVLSRVIQRRRALRAGLPVGRAACRRGSSSFQRRKGMPKGVSVHIGVNTVDPAHYGGWSGPLAACEADAQDMQALAKSRGYATSTMLLTAAATREAVEHELKAAARKLVKGDILLLTYSGHGGQVPDRDGDEPDDFKDETWCLYDGQLLDDELHRLWSGFAAGVRILVLSDSCHSGTATRAALASLLSDTSRAALQAAGVEGPVRFRVMPDEVALRTYRQNATFYDKLQAGRRRRARGPKTTLGATVRLISGCQDNQLSADGTFNGLFTGMLLRVWNGGAFKRDYNAFHRAIVDRMPPVQTPNHFVIGSHNPAYASQVPFAI